MLGKKNNKTEIYSNKKIQYLQMIQAIIERMSNIGLTIKGFCVTGLITILSINDFRININIGIAIGAIIAFFMFFDIYYFCLEKKYRAFYNQIRLEDKDENIDFDLRVPTVEDEECIYLKCCKSPSIYLFYGAMFTLLVFSHGCYIS